MAPKKGGLLSSFVRSIGVNVAGTQVRQQGGPRQSGRPAGIRKGWGRAGRAEAGPGHKSPTACDSFPPPSFIPSQALARSDIEPALAQLKRKLMERNVAEEIADK